MIPKPVRRSAPRAIIQVCMWARPGKRIWTYHSEEKIYFRTCNDAREWASKHGFNGVTFSTKENDDGE